MVRHIGRVVSAVALVGWMTGCSKESTTLEKAGKDVSEAVSAVVEKTADAMETAKDATVKAAKDVQDATVHAVEKTEEAVEKAVEAVEDAAP